MASEVEIIIRAVDQASRTINNMSQKSGSSLKNFAKGAAIAFGAVGTALVAAKKAFDFAKEGAQLEYTRQKFDRLTSAVGSTGDAMLGKLREATRGMVSDSQLVASAADFMSLGLAKTEDQVVRLTRVAGALGMDMNQLVLTLTNKTTMRFDALGVAVDGFDERVKNLEKSGLSVQDAFTEAFLQQAEAQIERVGDVADTTAGQLQQMEVTMQNVSDSAKVRFLPVFMDALKTAQLFLDAWDAADKVVAEGEVTYRRAAIAVAAIEKEQARHIETLHRFDTEIVRSEQAVNNWVDEGEKAKSILDQQTQAAARAASSFDNHKEAIRIAGKAAEEAEPKFKGIIEVLNADVASPIAAFRKDIQWWMAGGDKLNQAFADIKEGVMSGAISPSEADQYLGELEIAAIDLNEELGNISAREAAEQVSEDFHVSFKEARQWLEGTEGPVQALEAFTSKAWYVDLYFRVHGQPEGINLETSGDSGGSKTRRRQHGGPVSMGEPYIVGERGPELFVPTSSGRVVSNDKLVGSGGDTYIEQNVYPSPGMNEMALANYTALVLGQKARRSALAGAGYIGQ